MIRVKMKDFLNSDVRCAFRKMLAAVPIHAGLPPATTMEHAVKLTETRLGHKKVFLPKPLTGTGTDADRALVFYGCCQDQY